MKRTKGSKKEAGGEPPPSKYAEKRRLREAGKRAPFDFKEHRHEDPGVPYRARPLPAPAHPTPKKSLAYPRRVSATIYRMRLELGCLFLRAPGEDNIYMPEHLRRGVDGGQDIDVGHVIDGDIDLHPNGKGPRVTRIFSITPAS